jgi:hypothetical protein
LSGLRWAGQVTRQDDDDLARRVLLSEPGGKRPSGRPRLRWEDGVKEDGVKEDGVKEDGVKEDGVKEDVVKED